MKLKKKQKKTTDYLSQFCDALALLHEEVAVLLEPGSEEVLQGRGDRQPQALSRGTPPPPLKAHLRQLLQPLPCSCEVVKLNTQQYLTQ